MALPGALLFCALPCALLSVPAPSPRAAVSSRRERPRRPIFLPPRRREEREVVCPSVPQCLQEPHPGAPFREVLRCLRGLRAAARAGSPRRSCPSLASCSRVLRRQAASRNPGPTQWDSDARVPLEAPIAACQFPRERAAAELRPAPEQSLAPVVVT